MFNCLATVCMSMHYFFFFKQKTAYEMRISDWSSDVCSSDLLEMVRGLAAAGATVYLHGRDLTQMTDAIRALGTQAGDIRPLRFELGDEAAVARALDELLAQHGVMELLVHNASVRDRRAYPNPDPASRGALLAMRLIAPFPR